jgi:hypothetical protein
MVVVLVMSSAVFTISTTVAAIMVPVMVYGVQEYITGLAAHTVQSFAHVVALAGAIRFSDTLLLVEELACRRRK